MRLAKTYYDVRGTDKRIQVHQGGTRSGKTYSILLSLIELAYRNRNAGAVITICRKTFPALRATAMRDFFEVLQNEQLYNPDDHNKSEGTYKLYGNLFEFVSVDQPQKIRGRKRNVLFINEANECTFEDWRQLILRTTGKIIVDFNPSDEYHWLYESVITRDDAAFFKTTYLDNPFLETEVVEEIERLKDADENYWRVYGLGERGVSRSTIFTHYKIVPTLPESYKPAFYGLDFGYTADPTAIVETFTDGHGFAIDEVGYATQLSNADIAKMLRDRIEDRRVVIADCAEPKSIAEIRGHGINILPCRKGGDSVRTGISFIQSRPLLITERSVNVIKELRNYRWQEDRDARILNVPVDKHNHAIDALRYAITYNQSRPNYGSYQLG